ncbi:MAG TPA: hypothetical protein VJJ52_01175 [Candidatus Nanoarchaeia archaeon]|nr:hypothetical protein [Candidatus Nanoarchaeia archaeon]
MAETIDDRINNNIPPQQKNEEQNAKKPQGPLESLLDELGDLFNLGIATAAPVAGYALTGNAGVLATSAAYVAATKGKKDSKVIRNESLSGALFGTFVHYSTLPLKLLSSIGRIAYMIPWVFGANAFYMAEDHLIKEKSPRGLYKKFRENYLNIIKKAFMLPAPLNILAALFLPQQYMVASAAVTGYLFRRFVAGGKGEEQTDKTPYLTAAPNVAYKLIRNTTKGLYDAVYALGSSVNDLYKSSPKLSAPAQRAPAGGTQHP